MSKKVVIISGSFRKNSNSHLLAEAFAKGAVESGNDVEIIRLAEKTLGFCRGCLACQKTGKCVLNDDGNEMMLTMCDADVIVWATPIYYYEMSGQTKTMIDRANALYARDYRFREVYVLTSAAEAEDEVPNRAISGVQGWIDCFEGVTLKGTVFAGGVTLAGEAKGHPAIEKSYEMGKCV